MGEKRAYKARKSGGGRKKLKPEYDAGKNMKEQMDAAVALYNSEVSLQAIGEELGLNPIKVRKLLITSVVYESEVAEKVQDTFEEYRETQDYITSILAELNMEQFRRVPLYESYMADEITEEQYQAEVLDYEEAHRKLNKQLTAIMENTMVWERALSLRNPWIQQMEQYKTPEALDRNFVKKYIEQVVVTFLGDRQAEISLTMKTEEWKQMLERIELEGTDDGTKK